MIGQVEWNELLLINILRLSNILVDIIVWLLDLYLAALVSTTIAVDVDSDIFLQPTYIFHPNI